MNYNKAEFITSYGISTQLPPSERIEIAFAGRSNVGKSSLINRIFNRKNMARVSSMPGKTATINFYRVEEVDFVDLPGYGYAKVAKSEKYRWSELIEGYFNQERNLALVMLLVDMRHPPTALDLQMIEFLIDRELPFLIALTKRDKLSKRQQQERLEALKTELPSDEIVCVPVSSQTGEGIEELRTVIDELAEEE